MADIERTGALAALPDEVWEAADERQQRFLVKHFAKGDQYFPLGHPPPDDIEAAARLLIRYQDEGRMSEEFGEMFMMGVENPKAVIARAEQLRRERP